MPRTDRKSKRKNHDKADESFKPVMVDVSAPSVDPQAPEEPETASDTASKVESGFPSDADRPIITRDLSPATGDDAEWPVRDWPASVGRRGTGYQVIIKRSVLNDINRHGKTTSEYTYRGRSTRAQKLEWDEKGFPKKVVPLALDAKVPLPSGDPG